LSGSLPTIAALLLGDFGTYIADRRPLPDAGLRAAVGATRAVRLPFAAECCEVMIA